MNEREKYADTFHNVVQRGMPIEPMIARQHANRQRDGFGASMYTSKVVETKVEKPQVLYEPCKARTGATDESAKIGQSRWLASP